MSQFSAIKFVTSYGEHCTATKKNGIVTIQGDKNGIRQMPLDEFMKVFLKDQAKVNLQRSPEQDTFEISAKN